MKFIPLEICRFCCRDLRISRMRVFAFRTGLKIMNLARKLSNNILDYARNGRIYSIDLHESIYRQLYFLGIYEPSETKVLSGIIRTEDVVLDKGERNNENVQKYAGDSI